MLSHLGNVNVRALLFYMAIIGHLSIFSATAQTLHEVRTFTPATNVIQVVFSPDQQYIASASKEGTIAIWEVATGKLFRTINRGEINSSIPLVFSKDNRYLAFLNVDKTTITVLDINTNTPAMTLAGNEAFKQIEFALEDKRLISLNIYGRVRAWNVENTNISNRLLENFILGTDVPIDKLIPHPNGKQMVSVSNEGKGFELWNVETGKVARVFSGVSSEQHSGTTSINISAVNLIDSGKYLTATYVETIKYSDDPTRGSSGYNPPRDYPHHKTWNIETGELMPTAGQTPNSDNSFYLNKDVYFTTRENKVDFYDLVSPGGREYTYGGAPTHSRFPDMAYTYKFIPIETVTAHSQEKTPSMTAFALSPDNKRFLTAGADNTIKLWNVSKCPVIKQYNNCTKTDCKYTINMERAGFYVAEVRLPTDCKEGYWGLSVVNNDTINSFGGFSIGSILPENAETPAYATFRIKDSSPVTIKPLLYRGKTQQFNNMVKRIETDGNRTTELVHLTDATGEEITTKPLNSGTYLIEVYNQADKPRGYFGASLVGNFSGGVDFGGFGDNHSAGSTDNVVGFSQFVVNKPQPIFFQLFLKDFYPNGIGVEMVDFDIYEIKPTGERKLYWKNDFRNF